MILIANGAGAPSRSGFVARLSAASVFALGASAFGWLAIAQEDDSGSVADPVVEQPQSEPEAVRVFDSVVVTARRREERLQDAPVAISAFSGDQLEQYAVTNLADLTSLVPSMVVGRQVNGSSASIFLRGVGSSPLSAAFDQSVSFNLDGVPMSRGREVLFSQFDVDLVEVLKGPQALYYGKNTTGGLVSITTRGPSDEFEALGKIGYGFEGKETYAEGVVSGPITDKLGARFAFRASESRGALINSAGPAVDPVSGYLRQPQSSHRGGNETVSGRLTLQYDPTSDLNLVLKIGATQYEDNGGSELYERICGGGRTVPRPTAGIDNPFADCAIDGRADHATIPAEVAPYLLFGRDGKPYTDLESKYAVLNGSYDFGSYELSSITGYYGFRQQDNNEFNGATRTVHTGQLADFSQFSQEVRLQSNWAGPVNVMVGGLYADSSFDFITDAYIFHLGFDPVNQTYTSFIRDNGIESETLSAFGEFTWDISPTLELSGGARWSRDERISFQQSLQAHAGAAATFPVGIRLDDDFSDENVSPQVTLRWRPNSDLTFYTSYKEGYKTGGYNISQVLTAAATVPKGQFGSETAKGWEAGVRSILLDQQLQLNATVYDYLYEDLQVQFFDPVSTSTVVGNAGELKTRGIEGDFVFNPRALPDFSFRGALAYNDAKYANYFGQCYAGQTVAGGCNLYPNLAGVFNAQDYGGRRAPKAPEWAAKFGGSWSSHVTDRLSALVTLDANYSSEYNFTDALRPDAVQDAFVKYDASVSLIDDDRGWKLSLIGRNLTNEYVVTSANDMGQTGGTGTGTVAGDVADMAAIVERPREVYLELSVRF